MVLGVSMDSTASHRKFKEKCGIPFQLLSDTQGKVCGMYGVLKQQTVDGKTFMGIERSTFVIDTEGKVVEAYRGVNLEGHIRELLDTLSG